MFPTKMQNVQVRRKTPWVKDGGAFVPLWVQDANGGKEKRWTLKMQKESQALHENAQRFTSSEVAEKSRSLSRDPERASVTILNKLTMKTWKSALPNHCKSQGNNYYFDENRLEHGIGTETRKIPLNGGFEKSKVRSWIRHGVPHCRGLAPFSRAHLLCGRFRPNGSFNSCPPDHYLAIVSCQKSICDYELKTRLDFDIYTELCDP